MLPLVLTATLVGAAAGGLTYLVLEDGKRLQVYSMYENGDNYIINTSGGVYTVPRSQLRRT